MRSTRCCSCVSLWSRWMRCWSRIWVRLRCESKMTDCQLIDLWKRSHNLAAHFELTGSTVTKYYFAGVSRVAMRKYTIPMIGFGVVSGGHSVLNVDYVGGRLSFGGFAKPLIGTLLSGISIIRNLSTVLIPLHIPSFER